MNKSAKFLAAHATAKSTRNNFPTYRAAFAAALKTNSPVVPANYIAALEAIKAGGKFNGVVYTKNNGKNWAVMFVYVDSKFYNLGSIVQKDASAEKQAFLSFVSTPAVAAPAKNEWLVDEEKVSNNLSYSEMYNRYGMDFE